MSKSSIPSEGEDPRILRKALETLQVGVTIADCDGRILYVNPADAEAHGYRPDELIGKDVGVFAPSGTRHKMTRQELREAQSWRREGLNVARDGRLFPVDMTSDVLRDSAGEPLAVVTTCQDITERRATERELNESRQRFELVVRGCSEGIWDWNLADGSVYFSPRFLVTLGLPPSEAKGRLETWLEAVHPEDGPGLRQELDRYLKRKVPRFEHEHRVQRGDGGYRWMRAHGVALWHEDGSALRVVGSLADITELKAIDGLTQLPNRASLMDRLDHVLALSRRRPVPSFALLFLDVDRFKIVNDSLGHLVGDQLLEQLSRRLLTCLRGSDTLARYGGDEFAVVIEDIGGERDALIVAERIHDKLRRPFEVAGKNLYVTVSIGVVFHRREAQSPADLLRDADLAMYRAKDQGRGRHRVFEESLRAEAEALLEVETDLRTALDHPAQLRVEYQPIYDLSTERLYGFEALMRWDHPQRGTISPAEFLPVAEDTGMIVPLGKIVLDEACREMAGWISRDGCQDLVLTVNLSARQILEEGLVAEVQDALDQSGLSPEHLLLEITETSLLEHTEQVVMRIQRLRELGLRVALDDFGTGYSSLRYLQQYPIDILKIDRSFVQQLGPDGQGAELVRTLLGLGSDLQIGVIAEGIEERVQLESLQQLHCRLGQGFELSRPLRPEAALGLLEKQGT